MAKLSVGAFINACLLFFLALLFLGVIPGFVDAKKIASYSDLITDSAPLESANHTLTFEVQADVPAGAVITVDFPSEFHVPATTTFGVRNVEVEVNGISRNAGSVVLPGQDGVTINTGDGGSIEYELNPTSAGFTTGDVISFLIGNQTTNSIGITYA